MSSRKQLRATAPGPFRTPDVLINNNNNKPSSASTNNNNTNNNRNHNNNNSSSSSNDRKRATTPREGSSPLRHSMSSLSNKALHSSPSNKNIEVNTSMAESAASASLPNSKRNLQESSDSSLLGVGAGPSSSSGGVDNEVASDGVDVYQVLQELRQTNPELLKDISSDVTEQLSTVMSLISAEPNTEVVGKGAHAFALALVLDGCFHVVVNNNSVVLGKGSIIGATNFWTGEPRMSVLKANEKAVLAAITYQDACQLDIQTQLLLRRIVAFSEYQLVAKAIPTLSSSSSLTTGAAPSSSSSSQLNNSSTTATATDSIAPRDTATNAKVSKTNPYAWTEDVPSDIALEHKKRMLAEKKARDRLYVINNRNASIKKLEQHIEGLNGEISTLRKFREEAEQQMSEDENMITQLFIDKNRLQELIKELQATCKQYQETMAIREQELKSKSQMTISELQKELSDTHSNLHNLREKLVTIEQQEQQTRQQLGVTIDSERKRRISVVTRFTKYRQQMALINLQEIAHAVGSTALLGVPGADADDGSGAEAAQHNALSPSPSTSTSSPSSSPKSLSEQDLHSIVSLSLPSSPVDASGGGWSVSVDDSATNARNAGSSGSGSGTGAGKARPSVVMEHREIKMHYDKVSKYRSQIKSLQDSLTETHNKFENKFRESELLKRQVQNLEEEVRRQEEITRRLERRIIQKESDTSYVKLKHFKYHRLLAMAWLRPFVRMRRVLEHADEIDDHVDQFVGDMLKHIDSNIQRTISTELMLAAISNNKSELSRNSTGSMWMRVHRVLRMMKEKIDKAYVVFDEVRGQTVHWIKTTDALMARNIELKSETMQMRDRLEVMTTERNQIHEALIYTQRQCQVVAHAASQAGVAVTLPQPRGNNKNPWITVPVNNALSTLGTPRALSSSNISPRPAPISSPRPHSSPAWPLVPSSSLTSQLSPAAGGESSAGLIEHASASNALASSSPSSSTTAATNSTVSDVSSASAAPALSSAASSGSGSSPQLKHAPGQPTAAVVPPINLSCFALRLVDEAGIVSGVAIPSTTTPAHPHDPANESCSSQTITATTATTATVSAPTSSPKPIASNMTKSKSKPINKSKFGNVESIELGSGPRPQSRSLSRSRNGSFKKAHSESQPGKSSSASPAPLSSLTSGPAMQQQRSNASHQASSSAAASLHHGPQSARSADPVSSKSPRPRPPAHKCEAGSIASARKADSNSAATTFDPVSHETVIHPSPRHRKSPQTCHDHDYNRNECEDRREHEDECDFEDQPEDQDGDEDDESNDCDESNHVHSGDDDLTNCNTVNRRSQRKDYMAARAATTATAHFHNNINNNCLGALNLAPYRKLVPGQTPPVFPMILSATKRLRLRAQAMGTSKSRCPRVSTQNK